VVERLVTLILVILSLRKKQRKNSWYHKAKIFSIQFCLNMFFDVFMELNNIKKNFQEDNVDVTLLGITIDHALDPLKRYFCKPNSFTKGSVHITKFLKDSKDGLKILIKRELYIEIICLIFQSMMIKWHDQWKLALMAPSRVAYNLHEIMPKRWLRASI